VFILLNILCLEIFYFLSILILVNYILGFSFSDRRGLKWFENSLMCGGWWYMSGVCLLFSEYLTKPLPHIILRNGVPDPCSISCACANETDPFGGKKDKIIYREIMHLIWTHFQNVWSKLKKYTEKARFFFIWSCFCYPFHVSLSWELLYHIMNNVELIARFIQDDSGLIMLRKRKTKLASSLKLAICYIFQ
jgi:hypothetical protein